MITGPLQVKVNPGATGCHLLGAVIACAGVIALAEGLMALGVDELWAIGLALVPFFFCWLPLVWVVAMATGTRGIMLYRRRYRVIEGGEE
jgi:hypothetical protein